MTDNFVLQPLGRVAKVRSGFAFKSEDMGTTGFPVIKIKNVVPPRVDITECERVPEEVIASIPRVERFELKEGDTLIAMTGATVGKVGRFPCTHDRHFLNQRVGKVFLTEADAADYRYLYYILSQDTYVRKMFGIADGSAQANISGSQIESLEVPLPSLAEQKAIAAVLGGLDDKIELNQRMNATLEAMARALFQSWFVDFDPVRAKLDGRQPVGMDEATAALFPDSFEETEVGHIPEGWEVGRLGRYLDTEIGGDWGEDERFNGAIEVVALRGVDLEHLRKRGDANPPRRWIKESSFAKRKMTARDILVASSGAGPCGRPLWVSPKLEAVFPVPVLYSNFCKRYRATTQAHAMYFDRLLFEMRASGEIWDYINGTSLPNLDSNGLMAGKSVLVPPVEILEKFAAFVRPLYERLYSCESRTLATLRDTLLPKLLSGELRVGPNLKRSCT
jgi:type I restriction enzyme S subunit